MHLHSRYTTTTTSRSILFFKLLIAIIFIIPSYYRFGLRGGAGLDALPLGAQLFEQPGKLSQRVDLLKKMLVHSEPDAKVVDRAITEASNTDNSVIDYNSNIIETHQAR